MSYLYKSNFPQGTPHFFLPVPEASSHINDGTPKKIEKKL